MQTAIMLTFQLGDADEEQKLLFDEEMRRHEWLRSSTGCHRYHAEFQGAESDAELLEHLEEEVTRIAEFCGISGWTSVCAFA